ncbi:MAG: hypothetical protein ABFS34_04865 [Gemmatimonadota bacterium]
MRRYLPLAALSFVAVLFSCDSEGPVGPADLGLPLDLGIVSTVGATCGDPTVATLVADGSIPVGSVEILNGEDDLYVVYRADPGWPIYKTALYVGAAQQIPTNPAGNPLIGKFPYKANHQGLLEVIWQIDATGLSGDVVVAAFAEVGAEPEGAWAGAGPGGSGVAIAPGKGWATYVVHTLAPCSVEQEVMAASGGTVDLNGGDDELIVPAGSLEEDVVITATPTTSPDPSVLTAYDFGPDGLTFDPPASLALTYVGAGLTPGEEARIRAVQLMNGGFEILGDGGSLDAANDVVIVDVPHFSAFGLAVVEQADLVADLTVNPNPPVVGVGGNFTFIMRNAMSTAAVDGTLLFELTGDVTLEFPVVLPCLDISGSSAADIAVECPITALAELTGRGRGVSIVAGTAGEMLQALVRVTPAASVEELDPADNELMMQLEVADASAAEADLGVFVAGPTDVAVGAPTPYEVQVHNLSQFNTATGAEVEFFVQGGDPSLPNGLPGGCADESMDPAVLSVRCVLSDILPGATAPVLVDVAFGAAGTAEVFATVFPGSPTDPNAANDQFFMEVTVSP